MKKIINLIIANLLLMIPLSAQETQQEFYQVIEKCRKNPEKWPAIAYAVKIGRQDIVKFLIDAKEPINVDTPSKPVWYEGGTYFDSIYRADRNEPGYTALELAVIQQDAQMVKILLTHGANSETKHIRYAHLSPYREGYLDCHYPQLQTRETSPLWHALSNDNSQIVDLLLKSYKNSERLFSELKQICNKNNGPMIKSWIEQNVTLWNVQTIDVTDHMIDLCLSFTLCEAIESNQYIEIFLECGWIVSEKEFELAVSKHDVLELFLTHDRFEEGFNPFDTLLERKMDDLSMRHFSNKLLAAIAKFNRIDLLERCFTQAEETDLPACLMTAIEHGSLDVITFFIDRHFYLEGRLLHAVKCKQKAVVELLLKTPLTYEEIEAARILAYEISAYDIFELLN